MRMPQDSTLERECCNEDGWDHWDWQRDDRDWWKMAKGQQPTIEQDTKKPIHMHQQQQWVSLDRRSHKIRKTSGVRSYFSFGDNDTRTKSTAPQHGLEKFSPGESSAHTEGRRKRANLPPFKLEFDAQQKPMEIQLLNDLLKHSDWLNVNTGSYSTHPQSRHVLLVFANDSPTYEILFESSSWPHSICGLPFKVTLRSRIPTPYSVLVNRVPREWHVDSLRPSIAQRYPSTVQVARIFRDGQPINRIRVDLRSNEDVQKILQCSHISIDSIRYPAVA